MKCKLRDVCEILTKTINPKKNPEQIYDLYSLPSYDDNKKIERKKGRYISSNKIIIKNKLVLFNKLNLKFKRIWNVSIDNDNTICSTEFIPLKANSEVLDTDYLYYTLLTDKLNYSLIESSTGTSNSHQRINKDLLLEQEIFLPTIDKQIKIVKILKNIDKKIALNNQINDNLQKIGFELLSEEMEQNPVNELRNIIKFNKGKKPLDISEKYKEKYLPYLTIANLNNQEYLYASCEQVLIAKNDLLMVMDGASSGDVYYSDNGIVGSTLAKIEILDDRYNQATIYFILKYYSNYIKSKNTGSAIPHTDKEIVYKLLVPNIEKQEIYKIILDNILKLNNQNKILEQLRDTLLPKLMNGEIDLDKVEI